MILDDNVIAHAKCKGMLKKQGNSWKTWKNRFFVLDENKLYYLETAKDRTPLGVIYLQGLVIDSAEKETKWKWSFSITTQSSTSVQKGHNFKERKYIIQASNEKDYKMWLDALRNAVFLMKQAEVGVKDAPATAHIHVKGSKPAPDRLKYQSRSTDPTPSTATTTPLNNTSATLQAVQPRRYFSAGADMLNNQVNNNNNTNSNGNTATQDTGGESAPTPQQQQQQSPDGADVRSTFRNSVFEKAVTGLFTQPSSEITATLTEKDRKTSLLRNTLRGSAAMKATYPQRTNSAANMELPQQRSPSPLSLTTSWSSDSSASYNSLSSSTSSLPSPPSSPTLSASSSTTATTPPTPTHSSKSGRELHILITPWNDMARDSLFALLKTKLTNPLYAKTSLRIRIMASSVPDRTREELESRGVEVTELAWDNPEHMKHVLKGINKVLFLPGYSHLTQDWSASLLRAACSQSPRITQLIRVGVVGMGPLTLLGQWARAIDTMFENERIINTSVLIDQTYQDLCPQQDRNSQVFTIPSSVADTPIAPVDARDVAALIAMLLLSDTPAQSTDITMRGPSVHTYTNILHAVNSSLDIKLSLSQHSHPNPVLREVYEVFAGGGGAQEYSASADKIESIIGRPLISLESYLSDCIHKRKN